MQRPTFRSVRVVLSSLLLVAVALLVGASSASSGVGGTTAGAVYKGLALATAATGPQLYATDFADGRVDVFNSSFGTGIASGGFRDPNLPGGYAPFGIATVNGMLVVTYAKQQAGSE